MVQIIPAILATSKEQFQNDLAKLSQAEGLKDGWLHIDFADGVFVQNKTVGVEVISKFPANFRKEAHLMVAHPGEWVGQLAEADFERIIFHIESEDRTQEVIEDIKSRGIETGLAINYDTKVEKLEPFIGKIDIALVMTVVAGFQGQPFIPATLDKVKTAKSKWQVRIGVDGHVNSEDAKEIVDAGVDFMIVGSYLLEGDTEEKLEILWEEVSSG